jgi:trk system potassium uptake protein TrkH
MAIGGAAGSTAGGVKLQSAGVIVAAVLSTVRGTEEVHVFRRRVETPVVFRALAVTTIFLGLHFAVSLAMGLSESLRGAGAAAMISLVFEAMSAIGTVGVSLGLPPSYSDLGKLILCVAMFVGRLGPLTLAYSLQRRQRPSRYQFATAQVRIG